jgi:hypothetical protein
MTHSDKSRQQKEPQYRSLPVHEWPEADRNTWKEACHPGVRLKPGGRASHFAETSLRDFATRYGAYLDFLQKNGKLDLKAATAAQVTRSNVKAYVAELEGKSVVCHGLELHLQVTASVPVVKSQHRLLVAD